MSLISVPQLVSQVRSRVRCVDAKTAKAELADNNGLLIDVREPEEVAHGAVRGAVNIARGVLEMKIGELCTQADRPIYLHCASGGRAALAAEQLQRMGYSEVSALSCSFNDVCAVMG